MVSHYVPDVAARPWRLYYTRYYSEAAIHISRPTGTPIRPTHLHWMPRVRDQRIWPCGITAGTIANVCPAAQIAEYALLNQHSAGRPGCAQINLSVLVLARELPLGACRKGIVLRDRRHRAPLALRTWRCPETVRSSHEISCPVLARVAAYSAGAVSTASATASPIATAVSAAPLLIKAPGMTADTPSPA